MEPSFVKTLNSQGAEPNAICYNSVINVGGQASVSEGINVTFFPGLVQGGQHAPSCFDLGNLQLYQQEKSLFQYVNMFA